jgi:DNA-binding response OmpR family regulator
MQELYDGKSAMLLVVDDDADIRQLMKIFLEAEGYRVNVASDGIDAFEQLDAGLRPGLILLDLMMPRMDGEQFLEQFRSSRFKKVPVVILAGHCTAREKAAALGAVSCLMKPIEFDDLLKTIRQFVRLASKRDAA